MKCPIDGADLVITDRQGIEIDYCPKCRGVWLDRGELDKIAERLAAQGPSGMQPQAQNPVPPASFNAPPYEAPYPQQPAQHHPQQPAQHYPQQSGHYPQQSGHYPQHDPRHRKKSFFGELFDFD